MRQINPTAFAKAEAERRAHDGAVRVARFFKRIREGHDWMEATHQFRLKDGDNVSPDVVTMTGREAKQKNQEFDDELVLSVETYKGPRETRPRLKRWLWDKPRPAPKPVKPLWIP